MSYDLIIRDATIVSSTGRVVADIAIRNGRIAYVGPFPPRGAEKEISAIGMFVMPGVIDTAVQFDPNGDTAIWERESRAAVTGGITTVLSLPDGKRPVVGLSSARARAKSAARRSWCNFGLWGAAHNGNAAELAAATREGLLVGTLAYLSVEEGDLKVQPQRLESFLNDHGILGVQVSDDNLARDPGVAIDAVLSAARKTERHIHVVHLSTADELQRLDPVRGAVPVTAGVTPHHLFLSLDEGDGNICTHPPVRPEQDRRTLWSAMKRGRLDCIASDHHPCPGEEGPGVPGAELLFPLMLSAVKYGRLSLELLVSLCSERPAHIFGLETKGRIAAGADADLVLFSEGEITRVSADQLVSGAGWSPYTHREAAPKPELVIVNGQLVAMKGQIIAQEPSGTLVSRQPILA